MGARMRAKCWAGMAAAMVGLAGDGAAQGWTRLPNGNYAYATDYTTTGLFTCGNPLYLQGTCSANGNVLVLTSDQGASTTFTFNGASGNIFASGQGKRLSLGSMSIQYSGPGAPSLPNFKTTYSVFYFYLGIATSTPFASAGGFAYRNMNYRGGIYPVYYNVETQLGTAPSPYPYHGPLRIVEPTMDFIAVGDEEIDYYASAVVTPEPATVALLATGLAGVAGAIRRRRRSRTER